MGETTLTINADVQGALNGVNQVNSSMDKLNKQTTQYQDKSKQTFLSVETSIVLVDKAVMALESQLKQLTAQYLTMLQTKSKWTSSEKKQFDDIQNSIKNTKEELSDLKQRQTDLGSSATETSKYYAKLGTMIGGAFSVAAIIEFGKQVITSTGAGQAALERFHEGSKQAFDYLLRSIAAADFSNLIDGLKNSYVQGKLFADILSEIKLRQAALGAYTETLETQIAEQEIIMNNSQLSDEIRLNAIEKILDLEDEKLKQKTALSEDELDIKLRNAAVALDASNSEESSIEKRKNLVLELATAYETVAGKDELNQQIADAVILQTKLNNLITETAIISGDQRIVTKDYNDYNKALKNLTPTEQHLLDLLEAKSTLNDDQIVEISRLKEARQKDITDDVRAEASRQRRKSELIDSAFNKSGDAAKKMAKDTDDAYKLMRKAAEDFSKAVKLKPIFDTSQQGEQIKEVELFGKKVKLQFDKNIGAWQIMKEEEEKAQIEMRDNFKQFNEDRQKEQADAAAKMEQFSQDHPLAAALGFENEDQLNQIKDYADQIMSFINDMVNQQVEARTRLVEDWNQKIDEQQELVNRENEDRAAGLANNYEIEQQNLANMQKARDQAIKDREKSIKLQRTLSTVESSIALISAAANIIKGFSSIPVIGWILGIAAVGAMIAGFIAAQGKVNDAVQMEQGGQAHGLLKGKRHSQGGIPIEAEEGEWFINRNSSKKYSPLLDAINRDDQQGMKLFFDRKFLTKMPKQAFSFDIDKSKKLGEIVREMKKGKADIIYGQGYIIERFGGYTKKINLN